MISTEYWLLSTPVEKNSEETWNHLSASISKLKDCQAYKYYVPTLKVGTLDSLLSDTDNLSKMEMYIEGLIVRLADGIADVLNLENNVKLYDHLLVNGQSMHNYLISFNWDIAKFQTNQTISCIMDLAHKQAFAVENEYKLIFNDYIAIKKAHEAYEKTGRGTLLTRHLSELVHEDDFVQNSMYLETILVVVPKKLLSDWIRMYERLDDTVIPKSSRVIAEDPDYYLCGVTLFKDRINHFTLIARKFKFTVRNYERDLEEEKEAKEQLMSTEKRKEAMSGSLLLMLKNNFSEMFKTEVHIKGCRLFVESVLRYGLPTDYRFSILVIHKKSLKKVREILHHLYRHLESMTITVGEKTVKLATVAAVPHNPAEYYPPYVTSKIKTDVV